MEFSIEERRVHEKDHDGTDSLCSHSACMDDSFTGCIFNDAVNSVLLVLLCDCYSGDFHEHLVQKQPLLLLTVFILLSYIILKSPLRRKLC